MPGATASASMAEIQSIIESETKASTAAAAGGGRRRSGPPATARVVFGGGEGDSNGSVRIPF